MKTKKIAASARMLVTLLITIACTKTHAAFSPIVDISNALYKVVNDKKNQNASINDTTEARPASPVNKNKPSFLTRLAASAKRIFCHNSSSIEVVDDYFDDIPNHNKDELSKLGKPTKREAQYLKTSLKHNASLNNFGNEQKDSELTEKI